MSAKIIAVTNQKGGTGKTTTTQNLGDALAGKGLDVLLVDMDLSLIHISEPTRH